MSDDRLVCQTCQREFLASDEGIFDLVPVCPVGQTDLVNQQYMTAYYKHFYSGPGREGAAWGSAANISEAWTKRRMRQVKLIYPLISGRQLGVLCDVSAGAGLYTLAYSQHFDVVLHCDLSLSSLKYVSKKARTLRATNLVPIRADYFCPPFQGSLDVILCLDSLIRGKDHEMRLLRAIKQALAVDGIAVVDFHNWWHNPLRRIGLLKDNFVGNRSYARRAAESLLREAGIAKFEYIPFCQEFEPEGLSAKICGALIPPTRLIYRFGSTA
jgi:SAM-dependent methyltransferase